MAELNGCVPHPLPGIEAPNIPSGGILVPAPGIPGERGAKGDKGNPGVDGKDGRGIENITATESGLDVEMEKRPGKPDVISVPIPPIVQANEAAYKAEVAADKAVKYGEEATQSAESAIESLREANTAAKRAEDAAEKASETAEHGKPATADTPGVIKLPGTEATPGVLGGLYTEPKVMGWGSKADKSDLDHKLDKEVFEYALKNQLVAYDDERLTDKRAPLDKSVTNDSVADDAGISPSKLGVGLVHGIRKKDQPESYTIWVGTDSQYEDEIEGRELGHVICFHKEG